MKKQKTIPVEKLARVLRALVIVVFVCNVIAMFFVPAMVALTPEGILDAAAHDLEYLGAGGWPDEHVPVILFFLISWLGVWFDVYTAVLTLFLWVCGFCTAAILWQGKRVLDTVLAQKPFSQENVINLRCAAGCCFVVSAAALVRTVVNVILYQNLRPLATYNFLFVPIFFMGGLLFLVMSALFRQAAEMKAENDLTI